MSTNELSATDQSTLIEKARRGDERAYEILIEGHRAELHAHCYRMLASVHDADDAVQDALLRAWKGLSNFESRSTIRTWLFRIATNASLDLLKMRTRRELPVNFGYRAGFGETTGDALFNESWIEPYPDRLMHDAASPEARYEAKESLELTFVTALQYLPGRQRAVLILREVLGFSALDTAEALDMTVAGVNSALQRARSTIAQHLPETSQKVEQDRLGPERVQQLARDYADAIDRSDIEKLMALLTADAKWSMPPHPAYYEGKTVIEEFHRGDVSSVQWRHRATSANGQLAIGGYIYDDDRGVYVAIVLDVITLRDGKICDVTAFFTPEAFESGSDEGYVAAVDFERFGLPQHVND